MLRWLILKIEGILILNTCLLTCFHGELEILEGMIYGIQYEGNGKSEFPDRKFCAGWATYKIDLSTTRVVDIYSLYYVCREQCHSSLESVFSASKSCLC